MALRRALKLVRLRKGVTELDEHIMAGPPPLAGEVGKRVGDASTARQLGILDQMIRSRSPLAQQTATQATAPWLSFFSPALLTKYDDSKSPLSP